MYIDGHEREDVVEYRKGFVKRWREYERRFIIYGNNRNIVSTPTGFPVPQGVRFRLILVTHMSPRSMKMTAARRCGSTMIQKQ